MNLSKNQKILIGAVAVIILIGLVFLYRNAAEESAPYGMESASDPAPKAVPENVDGITDAIISETMADQEALDREVAGEDAQIQEDSRSVNDLGDAYDENSY